MFPKRSRARGRVKRLCPMVIAPQGVCAVSRSVEQNVDVSGFQMDDKRTIWN